MTLNHLNLTVADPTETSAFLAKYFGLQPRGGNLGIQMLNDDRGMVLTLIKARPEDRVGGGARPDGLAEGAANTSAAGEVKYPSSFHIGFIMAQFYGERKGAVMNDKTPRLLAWRARVLQRPTVRFVLGRMGAWLRSEGREVPEYLKGAVAA